MYGDKISQLRREANLTQSQLGDLLNVSAQAVSKWEHNLSEPDLATVKRIATIFNISIDDFLDNTTDNIEEKSSTDINETISNAVKDINENVIGYCTNCGCKVTNENVGVTSPKVLCIDCCNEIRKEEDRKERIKNNAKLAEKQDLRKRKKKSIIVSSIVAVLVFIFGMFVSFADVSDAETTTICFFFFLFLTYSSYAFTSELILDEGPIGDILLWFVSQPIKMPGVIFTLDIGGLLFLIFAKIGFAVLGFLLGVLLFFVGLFVGAIVAPFSFPFTMRKINKQINA